MPLAPHRCDRCRFPRPGCLCPAVPRVATDVEVIFLRHASERDRLTNTGHWASLALTRSRVLEQGVPGEPLDASGLAAGAWLVYPSPHPPPADAPVYVPGHWVWDGAGWVWRPGYWVAAEPGGAPPPGLPLMPGAPPPAAMPPPPAHLAPAPSP